MSNQDIMSDQDITIDQDITGDQDLYWTQAEYFQSHRAMMLNNIAEGREHGSWVWMEIKQIVQIIQNNYLIALSDPVELEMDESIRHMWWLTIEAAKLLSADDDAGQYRLVAYIAGTRARGPLQRLNPSQEMTVTAMETFTTSDGVVWSDLPFFKPTFHEAWNNGPPITSAVGWRNLNAFAAKITAVGAYDLTELGLWTIRDALETNRQVLANIQSPGDDQSSNLLPTVEDLLPAVFPWFKHTSLIFEALINNQKLPNRHGKDDSCLDEITKPGDLAREAGVDLKPYSWSRWKFWVDRLLEISEVKTSNGDIPLTAGLAQKMYKMVKSWHLRSI